MNNQNELTYDTLIVRINGLILQNVTMAFSNAMLNEHLLTPNLLDELKKKNYVIVPELDQVENGIRLTGDLVLYMIDTIKDFKRYTFEGAVGWLSEQNAVCSRCWVINNCYEGILNYLSIDKARFKKRYSILMAEPWFQVLTIIRHNVSHFDNHGKILEWKFDADTISWETIEFKKGQPADKLRYNDLEIFKLLQQAAKYLRENRAVLE